jgi:hypothetical protein
MGGFSLNNRLLQLYKRYWDEMICSLKDKELGNPLLLSIKDEDKFQNADIKIMFFGQETNSWEGELGSKTIDELLKTYSNFLESNYDGHFWNAVRDYVSAIKEMNPNKSVEYVWNNIIKVGKDKDKGAPNDKIIELQKDVFPVINEEIQIIKPNFIIFFTGPYYDQYIKNEWNEAEINEIYNFNVRQLALVNDQSLPIKTYRTYHPNYLYRQGKQVFLNIKKTIITDNNH